jgi:hypothetical protein
MFKIDFMLGQDLTKRNLAYRRQSQQATKIEKNMRFDAVS